MVNGSRQAAVAMTATDSAGELPGSSELDLRSTPTIPENPAMARSGEGADPPAHVPAQPPVQSLLPEEEFPSGRSIPFKDIGPLSNRIPVEKGHATAMLAGLPQTTPLHLPPCHSCSRAGLAACSLSHHLTGKEAEAAAAAAVATEAGDSAGSEQHAEGVGGHGAVEDRTFIGASFPEAIDPQMSWQVAGAAVPDCWQVGQRTRATDLTAYKVSECACTLTGPEREHEPEAESKCGI